MGFPCSHCGGGRGCGSKIKPIDALPPPPASAFDGITPGAAGLMKQRIAEMPPLQRMMAMMTFDPYVSAFTRYSFTLRLLCTNQSSFYCLPPPALPTPVQYYCTAIVQ